MPTLPPNSMLTSKTGSSKDFLHSSDPDFPQKQFFKSAVALGFVDVVEPFDKNSIPLVGWYGDQLVKSLALLLLEEQYGPVTLDDGSINIADRNLTLDDKGRVYCDIDQHGQFDSFELTQVASFRKEMTATTVLIGYLGDSSPTISTGWFSSMAVHELFFSRLACVETMLR